jgi:hypothetical protein
MTGKFQENVDSIPELKKWFNGWRSGSSGRLPPNKCKAMGANPSTEK